MRGRIRTVASLWIGLPTSSMRIVTRTPWSPLRSGSIFVTLPTLTPPMRTNEFLRRLFEVLKSALTSK